MDNHPVKYMQEIAIVTTDGELVSKHVKEMSEADIAFLEAISPNSVNDWAAFLVMHQGSYQPANQELMQKLIRAAEQNVGQVIIAPNRSTVNDMERVYARLGCSVSKPEARHIHDEVQRIMANVINFEPDDFVESDEFDIHHTLKVEPNRKIAGKHKQPFWRDGRW